MLYKTIKEISFLLAGTLIGIIFIPLEEGIFKYLLYILGIIIILILFGLGVFDGVPKIYLWLIRKKNKARKTICIYAPYEIDVEHSSWVGQSLDQLTKKISSSQIKFKVEKSENSFKKFPLIINPFGGVYPEKNTSNLESLDRIFGYVCNGGVYVNMADIPFYYAFDEFLKRRIDTTPLSGLSGNFLPERNFLQTILAKKLHCYVYAIISGEQFNRGITRIISLSDNAKNLFNEDMEIDGRKYSPILAIPYGRGYFVFSTLEIKKGDENNLNLFVQLIEYGMGLFMSNKVE